MPILCSKSFTAPFERLHPFHRALEAVGDRFGLFAVELQGFQTIDNFFIVLGRRSSRASCRRCAETRLPSSWLLDFFPFVGEAANLADLIEQPLFVHLFLFEDLRCLLRPLP